MRHAHATRRTATIVTTLVACAVSATASAAQATPTAVNVRIEGRTQTLFEGPILTEGHDVSSYKADGGNAAEDVAEHACDGLNPNDPGNTEPGPTSTAASVDAMTVIGETDAMAGQWYGGLDDYLVKQWGSEAENAESEGREWAGLINNVFTNVGGCQRELATGDEVLWVYNAFESRPLLALYATDASYSMGDRPLTAIAQLNKPLEVEVLAYEDVGEDAPPVEPERAASTPFAGAAVAPVQTSGKGFEKVGLESPQSVTTDALGKASITFTSPGWHRLMAGAAVDSETGEEEAIRSNRLDVCVPPEGADGCGEPPAEDRLRVPPRYRGAIGAEPVNWDDPRISGSPIVGHTVSVGEGDWTGTEPLSDAYRWQRCDSSGNGCEDIPQATGLSYEVAVGDEGHTLRAIVTAKNMAGSAEAQSAPTNEIPTAPTSTAPPAVFGGTEEGQATPAPAPGNTPTETDSANVPSAGTLASASSRQVAHVAVAHIAGRELELTVSVPGKVTVAIARRTRRKYKLGWRRFKTLTIKASKAGTLNLELPALTAGSYRLSIALNGSKPVSRVVTIHRH
jgi:hypothetical protein